MRRSIPGFFWFGWPHFVLKNKRSSPDEAEEKCPCGISIVFLNYSDKITFRSHDPCSEGFPSWLWGCACLRGSIVGREVDSSERVLREGHNVNKYYLQHTVTTRPVALPSLSCDGVLYILLF